MPHPVRTPGRSRSAGGRPAPSTSAHRAEIAERAARPRRVAVLLIGIVLVCGAVRARAGGGGWTREEGEYYVKIDLSSLTADRQFGLNGRPEFIFNDPAFLNGKFGVTDINVYGELGLNGWLTGIASTQMKVAVRQGYYTVTGRDSTASASGLGDIWLGGRMRLLPKESPYVAALTLSLKVPTGSPLQSIPLGTGVLDYEIAVGGGSSFPVPLGRTNTYGYAQLSTGFRLRNGGASNEMNYAAEFGMGLGEELSFRAMVDGVHSFADFDRAAADTANAAVANELVADQSFTRWGLSVVYGVNKRMDLSLGYSWNVAGRNTLQLSGLSIGVAWKHK